MHISWLGQTAMKLQTKNGDQDVVIAIDTYKPTQGDFPRSLSPDIGLFSVGTDQAIGQGQETFVLDTLGECDIKQVMISAYPGSHESLVFSVTAEGIHLVHLGRITSYDDALVEKIGSVDVLCLPVGGGKNFLKPEDAAALVTALEPRIVIPIAYKCDTDQGAETLQAFLKEAGLKPTVTDKKIIIKKKDLPQEETQLMVLEKNV